MRLLCRMAAVYSALTFLHNLFCKKISLLYLPPMSQETLFAHGHLWAFVVVFGAGFATSLTPCVYPLISITVSLFGGRGEGVTRSRAMALATAYVGGIAAMYTTLGVVFALSGRAFGTFMSDSRFMIPVAIVLLLMAASMFGAFEMNLPSGLATRLSQVRGRGFGGAFAMGLVGGIIAAPCTGPVLASVLAYVASTRSVALGGGLLFTYALGMGVLFFAIAAFAVSLPRSGGWMETVKTIFGTVMIVVALYFLRNVSATLRLYGSYQMLWLVAHLGIAAVGLVLSRGGLSFHTERSGQVRVGFAVLAFVLAGFGTVGYVLTAKPLDWIHGEAAGVAAAKTHHQPALLDFYADWCLPCKEMELKTFGDDKVAAELKRFTLVKVDCTHDDDPTVADAQKRYQADTLPTVVLLDSSGKTVQKFNRVVEPSELLPLLRGIN